MFIIGNSSDTSSATHSISCCEQGCATVRDFSGDTYQYKVIQTSVVIYFVNLNLTEILQDIFSVIKFTDQND